jgi:hypothetical protein
VRHLNQDAGTVAGEWITPGCATVHEVQKKLNAVSHDRVRRAPVQCRNETDAAGIMFVSRVIQARG